jgi:hypothetical protein
MSGILVLTPEKIENLVAITFKISMIWHANSIGSVTMSVQIIDGSLILNWQYGTPQSATNISGPWNDIIGVIPPYINALNQPKEYFRVQLQ